METLAKLNVEETRLLTELAQVRAAKAVLRRVCGLTDPPHGPSVSAEAPAVAEELPGKPEPRPSSGEPGVNARGQHPDRARLIARAILARGPMRTGEIAACQGITQPTTSSILKRYGEWFRHTTDSPLGPWELTEAGRAAAAGTA